MSSCVFSAVEPCWPGENRGTRGRFDGSTNRVRPRLKNGKSRSGKQKRTRFEEHATTLESEMSSANIERARVDIADDEDDHNEIDAAPSSWICYRVVLIILLALCVFVVGFVASCNSFRYVGFGSSDNVDVYYGFRGVKDQSTDRCVDWKIGVDIIGYNDKWIERLTTVVFGMAVTGTSIVVAALIAWVAYGIILKSRRKRKGGVDGEASKRPLWPVVMIGVFLILAGLVLFASVMGNCSNIPPLSPGGLGCSLYAWSGLALGSSIVLCFLGGTLACFIESCNTSTVRDTSSCCTRFLKIQLIED
mmetsp:Transcript_5786/g.16301  ORF Transcript_5786/g.16301 Transcript_5786/m.16301 type:complete len:305 (+) Transcript_5786:3-917(+)